MLRLLLVLLCLALPVRAEQVVAGLSQNRVAINTNFDGLEILIFGAVKREEAIATEPPLQVIVTVAGPSRPLTVRKKDRRFGIWVNADSLHVDRAPTFYVVATSAAWDEVLSFEEDFRNRISIPRAIRADGAPEAADTKGDFTDALIRLREETGLYQTLIGEVELTEDTLFRATVALPANLTEGEYVTRFFLTRGGEIIDRKETVIFVHKVGLERFLFSMAHEQPLLYGLMSIMIAIGAGWGASTLFRYLRG
ncbi:TIGR02186 family protein [Palleronia sp. KMU-117]|uniref:TIGR02186 family protein n=1 Tax=Palleronia sp. KMU-117 TaxID=3434108 RepID=UPI003D73342D